MISRIRNFTIVLVMCCIGLFAAGAMVSHVDAADVLVPKAVDNTNIKLIEKSDLVVVEDGYMRVFCDDEQTGIEYYDNDFNIQSRKTIAKELPIWGGFYAGEDAYYLVQGQNNTAEDDTAEVIRVIKYSKDWKRLGAANVTGNPDLFGGEVRYPFDVGCVEMTERNGILYIVTGHEGYVDDSVGQGHQGFLMIAVDQETMSGEIVDCDLWHSFAQYIDCKDDNLYVLEQSEGSRYTKLSKYNAESTACTSIPVLEYGGSSASVWAISCYASVDGMAISDSNVLCIGTSIDQSKYDEVTSDTAHNLYLTVTPMSDFSEESTEVKWLTEFTGDGKSFLGTEITKVNDNRFLVTWEVQDETVDAQEDDTLSGYVMHYVFVDGEGNKISQEYTANAPVSDCRPIVNGNSIVYYASSSNMVNFYVIDAQTGDFSKKCYRAAGESSVWSLKDGVLTISGTGKVHVDTEANYRYPLSSAEDSFSYSSSDNSWKPIRDKVTKIVIKSGLESIDEMAFAGFDNLKEVVIEDGLKSIGAKAFYNCDNLEKITIPASVTEIGEDILWTGRYWYGGGHVVEAVIDAPEGSYARQYADENGIEIEGVENDDEYFVSSAPGWFKVKLTGYDDVKLSWAKVDDADEYNVYYKKASAKKWTSLGTTQKRSMEVNNLEDGIKYTFKIVPGYELSGEMYEGDEYITKSVYTLKKVNKPVVKKASAKKVKITWKNINGETGYQIAKSSKKNKGFKIVKTIKNANAKSTTIKVSKKKYYYKVRAYKVVDGKKIYAPWSKVQVYKIK